MLKSILIFVSLSISSIAFASGSDPFSDQYQYNIDAQNKTKELCQDGEIRYLSLAQFFFPGVINGFTLWRPDSLAMTPETRDLVNSEGFSKAGLYFCFGHNTAQQNKLRRGIIGADFFGHLVGFSGWQIPVSLGVFLINKSGFPKNHPEFCKQSLSILTKIRILALLGFAGYVGVNAYNYYDLKAHGNEQFMESSNQMIDSIKVEKKYGFALLQGDLDETNEELAKTPLDPQKRDRLLKRKAFLEGELAKKNAPKRYVEVK